METQFETLWTNNLTSVSYKKHGNNIESKSKEYVSRSNIVADGKHFLEKFSIIWIGRLTMI